MTTDTDWVEDVKRWYLAGGSKADSGSEARADDYGHAIGYEAAHPALQACHWPTAAGLTTDR